MFPLIKMEHFTNVVDNITDYGYLLQDPIIRLIEFFVHYCILMWAYSTVDAQIERNRARIRDLDERTSTVEEKLMSDNKVVTTIYNKIDDLSDFVRNKVVLRGKHKDQ